MRSIIRNRKNRRIKMEWLKCKIAFLVMIIAVGAADSEFFITPITVAVLALIYMRIVAVRLEKRGEFEWHTR